MRTFTLSEMEAALEAGEGINSFEILPTGEIVKRDYDPKRYRDVLLQLHVMLVGDRPPSWVIIAARSLIEQTLHPAERTIDPNIDDARYAKLGMELCDVLLPHVGERGETEGAVEVLQRIIRERDRSTQELDRLVAAVSAQQSAQKPVNRTAEGAAIHADGHTDLPPVAAALESQR